MIQQIEEQTIPPSTGRAWIIGFQNGLELWFCKKSRQGTIEPLHRDGQTPAAQRQSRWFLLADVTHKSADGCQPRVAGARFTATLLFQVIQESKNSWSFPIREGLLVSSPAGLFLNKIEGQAKGVPIT